MGKKNKDKYEGASFRYGIVGVDKNARKAMERYGIDRSKYTSSGLKARGVGTYKGTYEDMENDLIKAARSDYDTRRAIEAAAMGGDERALGFAEDGIGSLGDVLNVQDMQRKQHKELGNGGDFSSASDFAGLSYKLAERDRENMISGFDDKYASKSALEEMQAKIKDEAVSGPAPEPSVEIAAAQDAINSYESGLGATGTSIFGGDDVSQATSEASTAAGGSRCSSSTIPR